MKPDVVSPGAKRSSVRPQSAIPGGARPGRAAIIGYGAITAEIVACLEDLEELDRIAAVLDLPERMGELEKAAEGRFAVTDRLDQLLSLQPSLVVECAGHAAVRAFGAEVLAQGIDLMVASVGALADPETAERLVQAAGTTADLLVPSGAVAGIDGLLAARTAGLRNVTYSSLKPPIAWKGTPAEGLLDLSTLGEVATFFTGTARDAAAQYPQNANVGATVALAGLGFERTRVKLIADPAVPAPLGIIEADGDFGTFRFDILAYASPQNPKTSILTAHSIVHAMRFDTAFSALAMLSQESSCADGST